MIKSVVVPWIVTSVQEGADLSRILSALGFADGEGWCDALSEGRAHLANLGAIEVIHGAPPAAAELMVQVQDVQEIFSRLTAMGAAIECPPYQSHWGSRVCVAALGDKRVAFFEFITAQH